MTKAQKEAAVAKILGRKAQLDVVANKEGNVLYDGKHISFQYPAAATIYEFSTPLATGSSMIERFEFDLKSPKVYSLVQVSNNTANFASAGEISAAMLRHTQPNLYKEDEVGLGDVKAKVFVKKEDGAEKSYFWIYKNKMYSFVFTGPDLSSIEEQSKKVISTIVLK